MKLRHNPAWRAFPAKVDSGSPMPVSRPFDRHAFAPEEIIVLSGAYEDALRTLKLVDRSHPAMKLVAKRIIDLAKHGERDPVRLRESAVQSLSK